MANHIRQQQPMVPTMQQHLRKRQQTGYEGFVSQMQRIRSSPRQMIGWIMFIILFLVLVVAVVGHYMGWWTIKLPRSKEVAPASHLQYFFF